MTAENKAKDLIIKYYEQVSGVPMSTLSKMIQFFNTDSNYKTAKQCALITVNEFIFQMIHKLEWDEKTNGNIHYWQEVKNEIQKL